MINPQQIIQDKARFLSNVVNNFIVRPKGFTGISGLIFDVIDSERISLESDITDHYIEDNTAIQDHIALRPDQFTLKGYIGELNDVLARSVLSIATTAQRLAIVDSFLPGFTTQANQVYSAVSTAVSKATQAINQAKNLYDLFTQKGTSSTKQQRGYNYFYSLWLSRSLVSVETPWKTYEDMAITSVQIEQDGATNMVSSFSVSFKKIRTTSTIIGIDVGEFAKQPAVFADRAAQETAPVAQKGISNNENTNTDLLTSVFN